MQPPFKLSLEAPIDVRSVVYKHRIGDQGYNGTWMKSLRFTNPEIQAIQIITQSICLCIPDFKEAIYIESELRLLR